MITTQLEQPPVETQTAVNAQFDAMMGQAFPEGLQAPEAPKAPAFDPAMLALFMRSAHNPQLARVLAGAMAFDVAVQQYNYETARMATGEAHNEYFATIGAVKEDKEDSK